MLGVVWYMLGCRNFTSLVHLFLASAVDHISKQTGCHMPWRENMEWVDPFSLDLLQSLLIIIVRIYMELLC